MKGCENEGQGHVHRLPQVNVIHLKFHVGGSDVK